MPLSRRMKIPSCHIHEPPVPPVEPSPAPPPSHQCRKETILREEYRRAEAHADRAIIIDSDSLVELDHLVPVYDLDPGIRLVAVLTPHKCRLVFKSKEKRDAALSKMRASPPWLSGRPVAFSPDSRFFARKKLRQKEVKMNRLYLGDLVESVTNAEVRETFSGGLVDLITISDTAKILEFSSDADAISHFWNWRDAHFRVGLEPLLLFARKQSQIGWIAKSSKETQMSTPKSDEKGEKSDDDNPKRVIEVIDISDDEEDAKEASSDEDGHNDEDDEASGDDDVKMESKEVASSSDTYSQEELLELLRHQSPEEEEEMFKEEKKSIKGEDELDSSVEVIEVCDEEKTYETISSGESESEDQVNLSSLLEPISEGENFD